MHTQYRLYLASLVIYRNILQDPVLTALDSWLNSQECDYVESTSRYHHFCHVLLKTRKCLACHLQKLILEDDNIFSQTAEAGGVVENSLRELAARDLELLQKVAAADFAELAPPAEHHLELKELVCHGLNGFDNPLQKAVDWPGQIDKLITHYRANSRGLTARFKALRWDAQSGLQGISHPHQPRLQDLVGYDYQKGVLCRNTEQFLAGLPANHILLYGSSGTGKSTMIKALLQRYHDQPLRLVEVQRDSLKSLHQLAEILCNYRLRFILFIDDLSFEDNETEYKGLKAILEGSLSSQSGNILVYATSNRRHLVKEYFKDRTCLDEEIHVYDTQQEKISLADRFGITLTFPPPNREEYLAIVQGLAQQAELDIDPLILRKEALQWERVKHGPSGRTAQQFINYIYGRLKTGAGDMTAGDQG